MKTSRKKPNSKPTVNRTSDPLRAALIEVEGLTRGKRWTEARSRLDELNRRHPGRRDVLVPLVEVLSKLEDVQALAAAAERLHHLVPNDPIAAYNVASSYARAEYPFLSARAFHNFLDRWPDHEHADRARHAIRDLDPAVAQILADNGLGGAEGIELGELTDRSRFLMAEGDLRGAHQALRQILKRHPTLPSALNNLSAIAASEGDLDLAVSTARRVLAVTPENVYARANLVIYLTRLGLVDEAGESAAALKAVTPDRDDAWVKIAEALSYLGDDRGVIGVSGHVTRGTVLEDPVNAPLLDHLTAVAMARQGREGEARYHWGQARKLAPNFGPIAPNLDDLKASIENRHGAWAFPIQSWIGSVVLKEIFRLVDRSAGGPAGTVAARLSRLAASHPELPRLVPILLDRGDPAGRELALFLASILRTAELLDALHDFTLGQRGTDADRLRALGILQEAGRIGSGVVRIWQEGEWREIAPFTFEITDEPVIQHPPAIQKLAARATALLRDHHAEEAQTLLQQALAAEPAAPDLLNNLAMTYILLGRKSEAEEIVRRVYRDHPDYFFGQVGMAQLETRAHRIEAAHAILEGLNGRRSYHRSEIVALCLAEIELLLAEKNPRGARSWLDVCASIDPEHPSLAYLRDLINRAGSGERQ